MKSKLKGRKWSPEQLAKARATRAFNRDIKNRTTSEGFLRPPKGTSVAEVDAKANERKIKETIAFLTHSLSVQDRDFLRTLVKLAIHTLKGTL